MNSVDILSNGQFWLLVGFFAMVIVVAFFVIKEALKQALIEADEEIKRKREDGHKGGLRR